MEKSSMIKEELMMRSKETLFMFLFLLFSSLVTGQDLLPTVGESDLPMEEIKHLRSLHLLADTIVLEFRNSLSFVNNELNCIDDTNNSLDDILEKLKKTKEGNLRKCIKIVHVGDSHIRGGVFPNKVSNRFREEFGEYVDYESFGVNGATCFTFTNPRWIRKIREMNPNFLILSFGTNESHNRRFQKVVHQQQLDELIRLVRKDYPTIPILLTTPPGSYLSYRKNRRRTYSINSQTVYVVQSIKEYGKKRKIPVWDLYSIVGGEKEACLNWVSAKLMRPDYVHFLQEGYELQGELLFEALIKKYNKYVIR